MKVMILLFSLLSSAAYANEKLESKELNPESISSILEKVKEKVCVMTLRPDTVQIAAGPVVLTWQTERICSE
jgi:hypothetical protein